MDHRNHKSTGWKSVTMAGLILVGITVFWSPGNAQESFEAKEMCQCLETAIQSSDRTLKKRCLDLQEQHVKKLKEGSAAHNRYREEVHVCEMKLANRNSPDPGTMSFEEKVKHVCDCFEKARGEGKGPMECFQLQSRFGKTTGEKETEFNRQTNSCAG